MNANARKIETRMEHTPGPWRYDVESEAVFYDDGVVCPNITFLSDNTSGERNLADGTLMAAAPDLFELAKLFARSIEYEIKRSEKNGDDEGARLKTITLNLVLETIAKASA